MALNQIEGNEIVINVMSVLVDVNSEYNTEYRISGNGDIIITNSFKPGDKELPKLPRFEVVPDPERYFPSGVMGDPTIATADKGQRINEYVIEQIVKLVEELLG